MEAYVFCCVVNLNINLPYWVSKETLDIMNKKLVNQLISTIRDYDEKDKRIAKDTIEALCNCCVLEVTSEQKQYFADVLVYILKEIK